VIHGRVEDTGIEPGVLAKLFSDGVRPQAIVTTNDSIAIALIDELESLGHRVPHDVSLVGFDGSRVGALSRVGLTTVAQPVAEMARRSAELLLERVLGEVPEERQHVRLAPRLIVGASTAPAAG
jgi:DNA-binding LacI/PurR family transcriptional regulator